MTYLLTYLNEANQMLRNIHFLLNQKLEVNELHLIIPFFTIEK